MYEIVTVLQYLLANPAIIAAVICGSIFAWWCRNLDSHAATLRTGIEYPVVMIVDFITDIFNGLILTFDKLADQLEPVKQLSYPCSWCGAEVFPEDMECRSCGVTEKISYLRTGNCDPENVECSNPWLDDPPLALAYAAEDTDAKSWPCPWCSMKVFSEDRSCESCGAPAVKSRD